MPSSVWTRFSFNYSLSTCRKNIICFDAKKQKDVLLTQGRKLYFLSGTKNSFHQNCFNSAQWLSSFKVETKFFTEHKFSLKLLPFFFSYYSGLLKVLGIFNSQLEHKIKRNELNLQWKIYIISVKKQFVLLFRGELRRLLSGLHVHLSRLWGRNLGIGLDWRPEKRGRSLRTKRSKFLITLVSNYD